MGIFEDYRGMERSVLSEAAVTITLILQKSLMPFTFIMARPFMP